MVNTPFSIEQLKRKILRNGIMGAKWCPFDFDRWLYIDSSDRFQPERRKQLELIDTLANYATKEAFS